MSYKSYFKINRLRRDFFGTPPIPIPFGTGIYDVGGIYSIVPAGCRRSLEKYNFPYN